MPVLRVCNAGDRTDTDVLVHKGLGCKLDELVISVLVWPLAILAFLEEILKLINSHLGDDIEDLGQFFGRLTLH